MGPGLQKIVSNAQHRLISSAAWLCLHYVADNYFTRNVTVLFIDFEVTVPLLWTSSTFIVCFYDLYCFQDEYLAAKFDHISIQQDFFNEPNAFPRGKSVFLTPNISEDSPPLPNFKHLDIIFMVPYENSCKVYSWYPIDGQTLQFVQIDTWENGKFEKNVNLFPQKFSRNKIRIFPMNCQFFSNPKTLNGPEDKMVSTITKYMNVEVEYVHPREGEDPKAPHQGFFDVSISYTERLLKREIDMAYGCTGVNLVYRGWADYSPIYYWDPIVWSLAAPLRKNELTGMLTSFSSLTWISMGFATLSFSIAFTAAMSSNSYRSDSSALIFLASLALPFTFKSNRLLTNTLFMLYTFYSLHIVWFYQSNLLSILLHVEYEDSIQTYEEAMSAGMQAVVNKAYIIYLFGHKELYDVKDLPDGFNKSLVWEGRKYLVAGNKIVDEYEYSKLFPKVALSERIRFLEKAIFTVLICIHMPLCHPLAGEIRNKVLELFESGLILHWFQQERLSRLNKRQSISENQPLGSLELQTIFNIVCIFVILSSMIFICEVLFIATINLRQCIIKIDRTTFSPFQR